MKAQRTLAGLVFGGSLLWLILLLYLTMVLPKKEMILAETAQAIPAGLNLLFQLGRFCQDWAVLIFPATLGVIIGSMVWLILASKKQQIAAGA